MSTLKATNIKNESSASNNIVLDSGGGVAVNNGVTLGTGTTISSPASDTFTVSTNGSERVRVDSSGRLALGTTSPGTTAGGLDISSGGIGLIVGSDSNTTTRTNSTDKVFRIGSSHYTNTEEPVCIAFGQNLSSDNELNFGGGSAALNAATYIRFFTAANNTTTTGTERARIDSSGRFIVGSTAAATGLASGAIQSGAGFSGITNTGSLAAPTLLTSGALEFNIDGVGGNQRHGRINGNGTTDGGFYAGGLDFEYYAYVFPDYRWLTGMRLDSAGRILIGTTSGSDERLRVEHDTGANWIAAFRHTTTGSEPLGIRIHYAGATINSTAQPFLYCHDTSTLRAEIRSNGGLANFSANNANLSDRNSKKDIRPAADTWDCVKEWEIVNYRYKDQPDDSDLNLGVIAQQVAESCPEVITVFQEAKEATEDQPAQEQRLGVKEQQMYWMAIKALQEAQERIETLEAKVAALEAQ